MILPQQSTKQHLIVPDSTTQDSVQINIVLPDYTKIEIYVNGTILPNTNYSVNNTGLIQFNPSIAGPAEIVIVSSLQYSKQFDFTASSEWNSTQVNAQMTIPALQIQQMLDLIAIKSRPEEYTTYFLPKLADRKNKFMIFDANGDLALSNVNPSDILIYIELARKWAISMDEVEPTLFGAKKYAIDSANSAGSSYDSAQNALHSQNEAADHAMTAQEWAISPNEVIPGQYSAKYWAEVASEATIPDGLITDIKINPHALIQKSKLKVASCYTKMADFLFIVGSWFLFKGPIRESWVSSDNTVFVDDADGVIKTLQTGMYKITISWDGLIDLDLSGGGGPRGIFIGNTKYIDFDITPLVTGPATYTFMCMLTAGQTTDIYEVVVELGGTNKATIYYPQIIVELLEDY